MKQIAIYDKIYNDSRRGEPPERLLSQRVDFSFFSSFSHDYISFRNNDEEISFYRNVWKFNLVSCLYLFIFFLFFREVFKEIAKWKFNRPESLTRQNLDGATRTKFKRLEEANSKKSGRTVRGNKIISCLFMLSPGPRRDYNYACERVRPRKSSSFYATGRNAGRRKRAF